MGVSNIQLIKKDEISFLFAEIRFGRAQPKIVKELIEFIGIETSRC